MPEGSSADPHDRDPAPLQTLGNVQAGVGRPLPSAQDQGPPQVGGQHHLGVLRHYAQQWQAGGVHGVVNGGAQLTQQLGLDADEIINMKMSQNEAKYPVEKAKGSAAKYDQL